MCSLLGHDNESLTEPFCLQVIVEKMMEYLRSVSDDTQKLDAVNRIHELAERFAPDTQWFLDVMNQARPAAPAELVPTFLKASAYMPL